MRESSPRDGDLDISARNSYIPDECVEQIEKVITGLIRHLTLEKKRGRGKGDHESLNP